MGYDLYCKLLNESVKEIQGQTAPKEEYETVIDMDIDAFIPERYIKNENQKLDIYKRIAAIQTEDEYDDMLEELMDRFGEPPRSVQNLLMIARLRAIAHEAYITELTQKGDEIKIVMYEKAQIDTTKIDGLLKQYKGRLKFKVDTNPYFLYMRPRVGKRENENVIQTTKELLDALQALSSGDSWKKDGN